MSCSYCEGQLCFCEEEEEGDLGQNQRTGWVPSDLFQRADQHLLELFHSNANSGFLVLVDGSTPSLPLLFFDVPPPSLLSSSEPSRRHAAFWGAGRAGRCGRSRRWCHCRSVRLWAAVAAWCFNCTNEASLLTELHVLSPPGVCSLYFLCVYLNLQAKKPLCLPYPPAILPLDWLSFGFLY